MLAAISDRMKNVERKLRTKLRRINPEPLGEPTKLGARGFHHPSSDGDIAFVLGEQRNQSGVRRIFTVVGIPYASWRSASRRAHHNWQMFGRNLIPLGERKRGLQNVLQFADIPRPGIAQQCPPRRGLKRQRLRATPGETPQQHRDQVSHVFTPLPQPRQSQLKPQQTRIEILTKQSRLNPIVQILMRGCQNMNVYRNGLGSSYGNDLALLQHPQQRSLRCEGELSYLIEQQCASIRGSNQSGAVFGRSGKRTLLHSKKLTFEQVMRYRCTVDRGKGTTASSQRMNSPCHDLFARSSRTKNHHGNGGLGHLGQHRELPLQGPVPRAQCVYNRIVGSSRLLGFGLTWQLRLISKYQKCPTHLNQIPIGQGHTLDPTTVDEGAIFGPNIVQYPHAAIAYQPEMVRRHPGVGQGNAQLWTRRPRHPMVSARLLSANGDGLSVTKQKHRRSRQEVGTIQRDRQITTVLSGRWKLLGIRPCRGCVHMVQHTGLSRFAPVDKCRHNFKLFAAVSGQKNAKQRPPVQNCQLPGQEWLCNFCSQMLRILFVYVVLSMFFGTACVGTNSTNCGPELCPSGQSCDPKGTRCVLVEQLLACEHQTEGSPCQYPGLAAGSCVDAVCTAAICGNKTIEPGERCDDGNRKSGDGCRSDCASDERCGNGEIDVEVGEGCDCGDGTVPLPPLCLQQNNDGDDAQCNTRCTVPGCNDGIVKAPEECEGDVGGTTCTDLGFYAGQLTCSPSCRFDDTGCIGYCGDQIVNGDESCDTVAPLGVTCQQAGFDRGRVRCEDKCDLSFAACANIGWSLNRSHVDATLYGVAHVGGGMFAVGENGAWLRFENRGWSVQTSPTEHTLYAITSRGGSGAVAVGDQGTILSYDGTQWVTEDSGTQATLRDVWKTYSGTLVAVGDDATVLVSATANNWESVSTPELDKDLTAVWANSHSDLFVAPTQGTILRWNENTWAETTMYVPDQEQVRIRGMWGDSLDHLYAVGDSGLIVKWDETIKAWNQMFNPAGHINLSSIAGIFPDDIFAVGYDGITLHYDGKTWRQLASHNTEMRLHAVAPYALGQPFAVGENGSIVRFTGTAVAHPSGKAPLSAIRSIWGVGEEFLVAVGTNGTARQFVGVGWIPLGNLDDRSIVLHSVWAATAKDVFAVGNDASGYGIFRYVEGIWKKTDAPTGTRPRAVWGADNHNVFAVGANGFVYRFNGSNWSPNAQGITQEHLFAVWGTSATNVYAVGTNGTILHFDSEVWTEIEELSDADLHGIWGTGPGNIYAVGANGTIVHFDGQAWTSQNSGVTATLRAISGTEPNDIFVVGDNGTVLYNDGSGWTPMVTKVEPEEPMSVHFTGVWARSRFVWLMGESTRVPRVLVRSIPWSVIF